MDPLLFYTVPRHAKDLNDFRSIYDHVTISTCPEVKSRHLPQNGRICRYCKLSYPLVQFKKVAHVLPQFLGNKYLVSEDECDTCNAYFGRFENDFKNYLGIIPTITQTVGQSNSFPTFRTPDSELRATLSKRLPIEGSQVEVFKKDVMSLAMQFDFENGTVRSNFTKHSYIPHNVYKALLKIGLSCLPIQYFIDYSIAVDILLHDRLIAKQFSYIHLTTFPLEVVKFPTPFVLTFSKREEVLGSPTHMVMLYYQNLIFQFFLPNYSRDSHMYDRHGACVQFCPPLFRYAVSDTLHFTSEIVDFSSTVKRSKEIQVMDFNVGIDKDKPFYMYDPKTGEHTLYEHKYPKDIVGFVTVPSGTILRKSNS